MARVKLVTSDSTGPFQTMPQIWSASSPRLSPGSLISVKLGMNQFEFWKILIFQLSAGFLDGYKISGTVISPSNVTATASDCQQLCFDSPDCYALDFSQDSWCNKYSNVVGSLPSPGFTLGMAVDRFGCVEVGFGYPQNDLGMIQYI